MWKKFISLNDAKLKHFSLDINMLMLVKSNYSSIISDFILRQNKIMNGGRLDNLFFIYEQEILNQIFVKKL